MWLLKFFIGLAMAQNTTQVSTTLSDVDPKKSNFDYEINFELALESFQSQRSSQRQETQTSLQNLALGTRFIFTDNFAFYAEVLGEQNFDDTEVYFGEVYLDYSLPEYSNLSLKAGNMYYNYGLLVQKEALLARRPAYYDDLLVTRRGIDLGATLRWQPLKSLPIYGSYSLFSGRTLRPGDQQIQQAEINPQVATLSYEPSFMNLQATYLQRKYLQSPTFSAAGLSAKAKPQPIYWLWLTVRPMAEYWDLRYSRIDGQERQGTAYLVGNKTQVWRFFHRLLYSEENWNDSNGNLTELTSKFQLQGLGFQFNKYFHFEYQNIISTETQTSLNLTNNKADVYRLYFNL
ncbi:MAG: hypothetical protein HRT44_06065 [Bdellovibrionales bacterium]|nr:hypothetical protein [Bdellovibrionales bacterium]NQZ18808.1 hypothetical protein [Bdellovibrionales bacterium]